MKLASLYAELLLLIQKKLCPLPNVAAFPGPTVVPTVIVSPTLNVLFNVVTPATFKVPLVPFDINTLPVTSNFAPGLVVPIPIKPLPSIVILSLPDNLNLI